MDDLLFYRGEKFDSFEALTSKLNAYCKTAFVHYWTRDSRKIEGARIIRQISKELKYYSLKYTCVLGGQAFHSRGTGQRYSFSIRATNCPAHISIRASKDGRHLEVISVNNEHNHEQTEEFFRALPKERKLSDSIKGEVLDLMKMNVDKNRVKEYVRLKTKKILTTKDLTNIISGGRLENRPEVTPERSEELFAKVYNHEMDACVFTEFELPQKATPGHKAKKRRMEHSVPKEAYGIEEQDSNVIIDCIVSEPSNIIEVFGYPWNGNCNNIVQETVETMPNTDHISHVAEDSTIRVIAAESESVVEEDTEQYCVTCGQHLPKNNILLQQQQQQQQQQLQQVEQQQDEQTTEQCLKQQQEQQQRQQPQQHPQQQKKKAQIPSMIKIEVGEGDYNILVKEEDFETFARKMQS